MKKETKRLTITVPAVLHELMAERARICGVSLSRYAAHLLKTHNKRVFIIPNIMVAELRELKNSINNAVAAGVITREQAERINQSLAVFESVGGAL